ncbi:RidA family protein [Microbacterium sp. 5K110]|jgi:enamine deaminase RidA (YjgF/YER057c/UK114 family)|uniref:RidA family protein n=1 Tax=unclassified Microbacterium TaxID=2609290 RepID=UPI0010FE6846|nr:RidA family protein [Microbacterium sp. 5K110]TLF31354.1 RidA family protein [Microbacterium sp. 5K110]
MTASFSMSAEQRAAELGLRIPDYTNPPYGGRYGAGLKAFHRTGDFVELSGITPETRDGAQVHPGVVGTEVSLADAQDAARQTAINSLGLIRLAVGSLDAVAGLSRALCFVLCAPDFDRLNEVSNGATDLFLDVFGPEIGAVGRASIGATSLTRRNSFELWLSFEARPLT